MLDHFALESLLTPLGWSPCCVMCFHHAHLPVWIEMGSGFTHDHGGSHSTDVLMTGWRGRPAAFDVTITSPCTKYSHSR